MSDLLNLPGVVETAREEADDHYVVHARSRRPTAPPALDIRKMLILSTSHLQRSVIGFFEMSTDDVPQTFDHKGPNGWIVWFDPEIPWSHMVMEEFHAARGLAEENGCTVILFDQDGDTVEGLPVYEW